MALPGGFFYVNTGLITLADNESEIAGVMGHEIAHIAARHGTRQATRGNLVNIGTIPLIFMGGWTGYGIRQAVSVLVPLGFLQFSRAFESEADLLGLQYMYKAGYDPNGFVDFFERLESLNKRKPGTISKVFSSHPPTGDRIVSAQKNIAQLLKEKPEYVISTSEFETVKDRILALSSRQRIGATPADANRPTLKKAPRQRHRQGGRRRERPDQGRLRRAPHPEAPQLVSAPRPSSHRPRGRGENGHPVASTAGWPFSCLRCVYAPKARRAARFCGSAASLASIAL